MERQLTRRQTDNCRKAIQTTKLLQRLQDHALNESEKEVMTSTQIRAAQILLDRALPMLSAVEVTGQDGGPLDVVVKVTPHAGNG